MEIDTKSNFNMGIMALERIHGILNEMANSNYRNEIHKWCDSLSALYFQIRFMTQNNKGENERDKLDDLFYGMLNAEYEYKTTRNREEKVQKYQILFTLLNEFDTYCKEILQSRDMLLSKKADITRAVLQT